MTTNRLLCDGWEFAKTAFGTEYSDTLGFAAVDLPHDWLIYDTNALYETSTGWYRRRLNITPEKGERIYLRFEGVYMDSRVYVNGVQAGEWKYGYSTFELDITELLRQGENLIAVRVDHREPNSRWYSGAGIYRRVWLKRSPECRLAADGVYISARADGSLTVTAESERPEEVSAAGFSIRHTVSDGGRVLAVSCRDCCAFDASALPPEVVRAGFKYTVNTVSMKIDGVQPWRPDSPKLYTLTTELLRDGEAVDSQTVRFGFRDIRFDPDRGFFINSKHLKLHGCCEHHDLGALGAAFNRKAMERKLRTLRQMGINAIRTSHNMPAVELMELADEMGMLILSEGFDMWEMSKTTYDYARFFPQWVRRDVASWIRRDRNHPSVIGWSIGNEIYDTHASERGQEVASLLMSCVREHDPRGNGYVTIGSNYMQGENAQRCADIVKLAGYNYAERLYDEQHAAHPDWMIYGSETASTLQSRGIYHFPYSQSVLCEDDEQCSSLGNCTTGWGAKNTEYCITADRDAEYCAGQFIWTGFDYIGEPTPYTTKNSYFGQYDTAGFAKDSAYIYRGEWTDYRQAPFVHIFPYWDFIEGENVDIRVASNAPAVELFFNGSSVGKRSLDHAHGRSLTLDVTLPYQKGELVAAAYDEEGREIARDCKRSFGDAARLVLTPDKTEMSADGEDMIFVEIAAYDENGEFVANANNRVFVSVSGEGRLVGLDNGDSTDYDQYKGTSRRLFSGKLLAMIAATANAGEIVVAVSSPTLPESRITLTALPAEVQEGISATARNCERECECGDPAADIPVRKIELVSDSRTFTADRREITFKTVVYPKNAVYADEIEYRLTNVTGIDSALAEIVSSSGSEVTVRCVGDGEFYLRALCKNGTPKYHIISKVRLCGEGIGAAQIDPYSLVLGGLHTVSSGNVGNGIQHGAAFASENSWFGFENVNFGKLGSDTVTVPIFANCSTPVRIRFYDGIPGEGGELIGDFEYFKEPIWMTYIPETYKLSRVLKGVHTLVMESSDGYNIEGFYFERRQKESAQILAADCESIYGDKFTVGDGEVTGIGNNVILDFGEFDFSQKSPSRLVITGRSELAVNSVQLIAVTQEGEKRFIFEFEKAQQYTERSFDLEGLSGRCKVSFVFLPGSEFDFKSFRFV